MPSEEILNWDNRFSGDTYLFGTAPNAFLEREAHRLPEQGRVLAVADGEGRNGVWLAQQGYAVHSIEGSAKAVAKAMALAEARGVRLARTLDDLTPGALFAQEVDVLEWAWPTAAYDAVAGIFIQFISPADRPRIFDAMAGALSTGGILLLEGYGPRQLDYGTGGPRSLAHLYDIATMADAFPTLLVESLIEYDAEVQEGTQHSGMSALVDLVAIKP